MIVSVTEFLKNKKFNDEFFVNQVICFKGNNSYQFLFFSILLKFLKENNRIAINFININEIDLLSLKLQLEQNFLGTNLFYWLGNISDYKNKNELLDYLNKYDGPHYVSFFIDNENSDQFSRKIVNCEYIVNIDQFKCLLILWEQKNHKIILTFIEKVIEKINKLTLDQACIFVNYSILLGTRNSNFINCWLEKILVNEQSLFNLSKFLFSFDQKSFFQCWDLISYNYPNVFWTAFWSDQLYKAYNYINFRQLGKNLEAKQIAYKLPFSFIQYDWKKSSTSDLKLAHRFIYDLDYSLKNNGSDISFDLFYCKFFTKSFA